MPVQIGAKPQADFSQPVDLLMDCHRRIERFIGILLRVVEATQGGELDDEHRRALEVALDYFRLAAPRHTEDEERSLFPRMRRSGDPQTLEALEKMQALEADHRTQELGHARVDELGKRWLTEGTLEPSAVETMRTTLTQLQTNYQRHIRLEDEVIFPLARSLSERDLNEIGLEMKQRRANARDVGG